MADYVRYVWIKLSHDIGAAPLNEDVIVCERSNERLMREGDWTYKDQTDSKSRGSHKGSHFPRV